jgi:hypothetical protein
MHRRTRRRLISVGLAATLALFALALPTTTRAENTVNISIPTDILVFIPCAVGGAGELVELSGNLHVLMNLTFDNAGGVHTRYHFQPEGISGVGLTTGDKYQGTGVTQNEYNAKVGFEDTFVNNFRIIGQGPGNNFLLHQLFHATVHANGDVTAFVDNLSIEGGDRPEPARERWALHPRSAAGFERE